MFFCKINEDGTFSLFEKTTNNYLKFKPENIQILILGPIY